MFPTGNVQGSYLSSLRLYLSAIFLKFRLIVGIALLFLGYIADFFVGFKLPPLVFGVLFAFGFIAANFLLFHEIRPASLHESLGLPQWAHGALNAGGGGSHLTVIHYGFPPKLPFTPEHFLAVRQRAAQHFGIPELEFETAKTHAKWTLPHIDATHRVSRLLAG